MIHLFTVLKSYYYKESGGWVSEGHEQPCGVFEDSFDGWDYLFLSRYLATSASESVRCQPVRKRTGGPLSPAEMFKTDKLKALVGERLTAAAEEIFSIFEQTIKEYEEAVFRSQQEVEQQRRQPGWRGNSTQVNFSLKTALTLGGPRCWVSSSACLNGPAPSVVRATP